MNYDKLTCFEDISEFQNKLSMNSNETQMDTINNDNNEDNENNVKKKN